MKTLLKQLTRSAVGVTHCSRGTKNALAGFGGGADSGHFSTSCGDHYLEHSCRFLGVTQLAKQQVDSRLMQGEPQEI